MQFLGGSFGRQFHDFLIGWVATALLQYTCDVPFLLCHIVLGGFLFPIPAIKNLIYRTYLVCTIWAHDFISTKSRGFASKKSNFSPATSESEKNTLPKQTVVQPWIMHLGIPPFAFLVVLLIKWGFFAPTTFKKHTVTVEVVGWRFVSLQGVMITGASEAWSTTFNKRLRLVTFFL